MANHKTTMSEESTLLELRHKLRALGYEAKLVNGDSFDIPQGGYTHYLSHAEAEALADAGAGIDLMAQSERRGLNRWYDFRKAQGT